MTHRPISPSRRPVAATCGLVVAVLALVAGACSGGDDTGGSGPVPTLLTAPVQATSTTSTTLTSTSTTSPAGATTAPPGTPGSTGAASSAAGADTTSTDPTSADSSATGPPDSGARPEGSGDPATSTSTTVLPTSSTQDIEPPPPSISTTTTTPIPTVAAPPDTIGGRDADYLLGARSIAGLQFGASRATVLERLRTLLGDPVGVTTLGDCPGGSALALQWFNASVIVTDRGLAYYLIGMNLDAYEDLPVPNWHTAAGVKVGDGRAQLDTAYPGQVTYEAPNGLITRFTVTGSPDAGISGRLEGDVLTSVSAGTTTC